MKKLLCILILGTSLNISHAQGDLNLSSPAQEMLKFINDPQNKNDRLNNIQYQNDTELVMFIMKSIDDKHIKEINKKIEFINSFNVSKDIKEQAISYVNQNITYSDNEKVSYGVYLLKKCNESHSVGLEARNASVSGECYIDYKPTNNGCAPERSNVCCT
jgi:hypothetical protein